VFAIASRSPFALTNGIVALDGREADRPSGRRLVVRVLGARRAPG
jgi:hypothetical protein